MAAKNLKRISVRLDEDLLRAIKAYQCQTGGRSLAATMRELIRAGLDAKRTLAATDPKKALHAAMRKILPAWNGETAPTLADPVKLSLPSGKDPLSLILERRRR